MRWVLVAVGYAIAAKLGLLLAVHANAVTPIWPPTGIALAALLVWGWPMASAVFIGASFINIVNNFQQGMAAGTALTLGAAIAVGNTMGPVMAAGLLRRVNFQRDLPRITDVWWLFAAGCLGAGVSALNGVGSLMYFAGLPIAVAPKVLCTWWVGDGLGFVGFAPVLLVRPLSNRGWRDLATPLAACVTTAFVVGLDPLGIEDWMPTTYLALLPLVWLGVRTGSHGVALGYIINAIILVLLTNLGHGPLAEKFTSPLVALASFLTIGAVLSHLLGVWSSTWQGLLAHAHARVAADERFRVLFEQSSDAHLLFDDTGIIDCNPAAVALLRYHDKTAVLKRHPTALSPALQPDGQPSLVKGQEMDRLARERGHHRFEWLHRRSDDTDILVEVSLTPVQLAGRDTMLVVWHDLTARKQAEEAVARARDAAENALRAKSDFLATMSHELRTPLNGVIGMAAILRTTELNPEQHEQAETIHACADHLLTLINDILDLSRLEAGKVDIEDIPCGLSHLVRDVTAMVSPRANDKGIHLITNLDPNLPAAIRTDPGRLRQILINLLGNAVKFTEHGSVTLGLQWQKDALRVTVADTGIGMDAETVGRLFQPFTQADASMARRYGGSGLGLAISRRLSDLLGANLDVTSTPGQGSVFTLHLPTSACDIQDRQTTSIPAPGHSVRILLAEDNHVNQKVATLMLKKLGHQVEVVENGQAAIDRLANGGIDLVLMDCQMPVLDGLEATRRLRAAGCRLPIIAMTANALQEDQQACREAGMDDHLAKPMSPESLARTLSRARRG